MPVSCNSCNSPIDVNAAVAVGLLAITSGWLALGQKGVGEECRQPFCIIIIIIVIIIIIISYLYTVLFTKRVATLYLRNRMTEIKKGYSI